MNFIPSGHVIPAFVQDAWGEVVEGALAETDTQPPSPNPNNEIEEDEEDQDEPSTLRVIGALCFRLNCRPHLHRTLQTRCSVANNFSV